MQHPASLLVKTWAFCAALWFLMPFELILRTTTLYGYMILLSFIIMFCAGSLLASPPGNVRTKTATLLDVDWKRADRLMIAVSLFSSFALMVELYSGNSFNLIGAYMERSDRAAALLAGAESKASLYFQLAFVTYPIGFIYLVRAVAFERKLNYVAIGLFGLLPPALASLAMGGRSPLLYAMLVFFLASRMRAKTLGIPRRRYKINIPLLAVLGVVSLALLNYFAKVFIVRAEAVGGIDAAYNNAAFNWGIAFEGPLAQAMESVLGSGTTYLIFIFSWYIVQGLVMSNVIFTNYAGPPQLGIYGVDLLAALVRRVDGGLVSDRFFQLMDLNVYGFLPTAFGSAFIDIKYAAFPAVFAWGWLAGFVRRKVTEGREARWWLIAPFISLGIVFSIINTPLGFSNGFVIHFWLIATFFLATSRIPVPHEHSKSGLAH